MNDTEAFNVLNFPQNTPSACQDYPLSFAAAAAFLRGIQVYPLIFTGLFTTRSFLYMPVKHTNAQAVAVHRRRNTRNTVPERHFLLLHRRTSSHPEPCSDLAATLQRPSGRRNPPSFPPPEAGRPLPNARHQGPRTDDNQYRISSFYNKGYDRLP